MVGRCDEFPPGIRTKNLYFLEVPKIIIRIIKYLLISPSPADRGDGDGLSSYRCQEELYEITV